MISILKERCYLIYLHQSFPIFRIFALLQTRVNSILNINKQRLQIKQETSVQQPDL